MRLFLLFFSIIPFLVCSPFLSYASGLPAGVYQAAAVTGTAVSAGGVSAIIPAASVAGVPAVGAASTYTAASGAVGGTVSTPVAVPLVVGGLALAGGYYIGSNLVTDLHDLYQAVKDKQSEYPSLNNVLSTPGTDPNNLPSGFVCTVSGTNYEIIRFNWHSDPTWDLQLQLGWHLEGSDQCQYITGAPGGWSITSYQCVQSTKPVSPFTPPGEASPATSVPNMINPDGTLKPNIDSEVKKAITDGLVSPSINTSPAQVASVSGQVAAQNNVDLANQAVQQAQQNLQTNTDPVATARLQQQLADSQARLADAQAKLAQADAEAARIAQEAADAKNAENTATANLGPANTYDTTIPPPNSKSIPDLLTNFFANSPLLGMVRTFQITTASPESKFVAGTFWGQEISFDFAPWQSVLASCGAVLVALAHGFAIMIIIKG